MISPSQLSARLRQIAAKIDNSEKPMPSLVAAELRSALSDLDAGGDLKAQRELEKKTKETLKKSQDKMGEKIEDLVEKGVAGQDISKAMGDMEREFKSMETDAKRK